jgi:hypothetical protein
MAYSRKASETSNSSNSSNIDWEGFNAHLVEAIGKARSRLARVVGIGDLGKQPRPNFKEKYDATNPKHIAAIKDKGATVQIGEYYADNKKQNGEYISTPMTANDQVSILVDFPEVMINYGKFLDDSGEDRFLPYRTPVMGEWWDKTLGEKGMMVAKGIGLSCAPNKKAASGWGYSPNNTIAKLAMNCVDKDGNPIYTGEAVDQDFDIGELMGGICTYTLGAVLHESGGKKYFNQTLKDCAPKHEAIPVPDVPLELFGLSYEGGNDVKALEAFSKFNPIMNTLTLGENYDKSGLKADFDAYFKSLGGNSSSGGEGSASPSASTGEKAATSVEEFDDADGDDDMSMFD